MAKNDLVQRLFAAASELPIAERAALLERECAGDAELRAEVESLLRSLDDASAFLAHPTAEPGAAKQSVDDMPTRDTAARVPNTLIEHPGTKIGQYKLLQLIGEGGFGSVFLAQQEHPVQRKVALKIIKLGMDTRQVIARFEQERQALAMMDHQNIARVLDAGATETGRPYFVMDLVKGDPIAAYCDKNNLGIQERLELFAQVCHAVQHAHTKGIIHRDIKPSNILVTTQDGKPVAKVIDFGIAKATANNLTEKTLFTEHRALIGTPEYMSPEQAEGTLDIDTRTDVYSLGVLLYELLTGSTPFDPKSLRAAAYAEIQRIIREVDPPRPSTRLSQNSDTLANVAARRHIEPRKLGVILRGELDWVVMKAMDKDRSRRYETANGLAMDIKRYLAGEPVVAAPPSVGYRVRKFVRRHRGGVFAGSAVALALSFGVVAFAWQASVARQQRDIALAESARAKATSDFVRQMLVASDAEREGNKDITVLQMLGHASASADKTLAKQPLAEATVRTLLGNTFRVYGRMAEAETELNRAIQLRRNSGDSRSLAMGETLLAMCRVLIERGDRKTALPILQETVEITDAFPDVTPTDRVIAYTELARTFARLSEFEMADQTINKADAIAKSSPSVAIGQRSEILSLRAELLLDWKDDPVGAAAIREQEVAMWRTTDEPLSLSTALNNLGVVRMQRREFDAAEKAYNESLQIAKDKLGERNHTVAATTENLANVYFMRKDYSKAVEMLQVVLKIREEILGVDSMSAARTRFNLASVALNTKDYAHALELINATEPTFLRDLGEITQEMAQLHRNRALCLKALGDLEGAIRETRETIRVFDALKVPITAARRTRALVTLIEFLCAAGRGDEAKAAAQATLQALDSKSAEQGKQSTEIQNALDACEKSGS